MGEGEKKGGIEGRDGPKCSSWKYVCHRTIQRAPRPRAIWIPAMATPIMDQVGEDMVEPSPSYGDVGRLGPPPFRVFEDAMLKSGNTREEMATNEA